jgi:hypothetical protein
MITGHFSIVLFAFACGQIKTEEAGRGAVGKFTADRRAAFVYAGGQ